MGTIKKQQGSQQRKKNSGGSKFLSGINAEVQAMAGKAKRLKRFCKSRMRRGSLCFPRGTAGGGGAHQPESCRTSPQKPPVTAHFTAPAMGAAACSACCAAAWFLEGVFFLFLPLVARVVLWFSGPLQPKWRLVYRLGSEPSSQPELQCNSFNGHKLNKPHHLQLGAIFI